MDDIKNGGKITSFLGGIAVSFLLLIISILSFIFPSSINSSEDIYLKTARSIKAEVFKLEQVRLIDSIVFFDGDLNKALKSNANELIDRFKKYFYKKSDSGDFEYLHLSDKEVLDKLRSNNLIKKEYEKDIENLLKISNDNDSSLIDIDSVPVTVGDIGLPLNHFYVTAGTWYYPDGGWHPGMDFGTPEMTPVHAPINLVKLKTVIQGDGYGVHGAYAGQIGNDTYTFIFGHNTKMVNKSSFKKGEVLSFSGNTGASTGPHLHVEIFLHKNKTLKEVVANFKRNQDYWFGLAYSLKGDCNNVCRLRPENVYKLKLGDQR